MDMDDTLSASLEDYLEAIFHIVNEKQAARAKDIAKRLKVGGSSVTGALRSLADRGLINYAPYDVITLTAEGRKAAEDVDRRHRILHDFFVNLLAVDDAMADEAACRMEHAVPRAIVDRLVKFAEFVEVCPRAGAEWIAGFGHHCEHGPALENCEKCISLCLEQVKQEKSTGEPSFMGTVNLKDLKPGQKARIVKMRLRGDANRRIVEMGVTFGAVIQLERIAPLGDPVDIKVKGYHLSLRKSEAEGIDVEIL